MTGLVDRVALSRELADLADRFLLEATLWHEPGARAECERVGRHLAQLSRGALWADQLTTLDEYARAADLLIRNVEGTRRFFKIVLTPPRIRRSE